MLPRGNVQFFFSIHTGQGKYRVFDSNEFSSRFVNQRIHFRIGKLEMTEMVESCNYMEVEYEADPLSSKFDINVGCAPREKDVPVREGRLRCEACRTTLGGSSPSTSAR